MFTQFELEELGEIITGKTPKKSNADNYGTEDVPFIKPDDLTKDTIKTITATNEFVSNEGAATGKVVGRGTVLVTCIGIIGKVGIVEVDNAIFNQQINAIIPNENIVLSKYLAYVLHSMQKQLQDKANAPIVPIINKTDFSKVKIRIPNLEYQRKVITLLDEAKSIIDKRQSQITALDELTQSIFLEMFGDSIKNSKNLSSGYLSDYINYLTSGSRGWAKYYSNAGELFITIKNVRDGRLFLNDITYVNAPETKEAERTKVQEGDLLLSITADLGRTAVVDKATAEKGGYINQHLALIRLNEKINPTYLAHFMRSKSIEIQLEKMNQNGVKAGLNFDSIRKLKILIPAMSEQEKFVTNLNRIEKTKSKLEESLGEIENLYNSLLQKAFKGKLF